MSERRNQPTRRVDQPEPGYFCIRLVKGGPWVAAEIRHIDGAWLALIDGVPKTPHPDPAQAEDVFRIWHYGERIPNYEHAFMVQWAAHVRVFQPDAPEANPTRPINVGREPPPF